MDQMEEMFKKALTRLNEHNGKLLVQDYVYIYGKNITFVFVDKNGRYISFCPIEHLIKSDNGNLLISSCAADIIGSCSGTMILRLLDKTKSDFKNSHGWIDLYKEI